MGCDFSSTKSAGVKVEVLPGQKSALTKHGWDKGYVCFALTASECSVKVAVALNLLNIDTKWITTSFDDKDLEDVTEGTDPNTITPGSEQILGVKSDLYKLITGGVSMMPALAIDGTVYVESEAIVMMLAENADAPDAVTDLIQLSMNYNSVMLSACKHWGWSAMHAYNNYAMVDKKNYVQYGSGNKSEEWEKETTDTIKEFFTKLEDVLKAKPEGVNGFYVGDELTLADASLLNWVLSMEGVAGLNVKEHYPNVYKNWEIIKAAPPAGSEPFVYGFPTFCDYVTQANDHARKDGSFNINNYW